MRRANSPSAEAVDRLRGFIDARESIFVLTGAGCSTGSGIPDYRDENGDWKRKQPVTYAAFTGSDAVRRRYWARSTIGFPTMACAEPNGAHAGLASLEASGHVGSLVTQNVDGLHQRAGHAAVLDLHGRIADVVCLDCRDVSSRSVLQDRLLGANPGWGSRSGLVAPDGDAEFEEDTRSFQVPECSGCGGMLKPDVVFFGENVPPQRVADAYAAVEASDSVLVVGSSLKVFSGWRFVRAAHEQGKPIAILNLGRTRGDDVASLTLRASCSDVLAAVARPAN